MLTIYTYNKAPSEAEGSKVRGLGCFSLLLTPQRVVAARRSNSELAAGLLWTCAANRFSNARPIGSQVVFQMQI